MDSLMGAIFNKEEMKEFLTILKDVIDDALNETDDKKLDRYQEEMTKDMETLTSQIAFFIEKYSCLPLCVFDTKNNNEISKDCRKVAFNKSAMVIGLE